MGELESYPSPNSNPVFIVIMRNSRGKLFVYVAVLGVLCFIVFLLSSTHTSLKELEGVNEKCQQQRDSLSAQLQVVYEHKNRLEKSLQQEKTDHRHTKEENEKQLHELENKFQEEKDKDQKLENQIVLLKSRYSELEEEKTQSDKSLMEQLKTITAQKNKEIEKLQNHISELLSEKDTLETSANAKMWKLEQTENELKLCHVQYDQAKIDLSKCQENTKKVSQNTLDNHVESKLTTSIKKAENDNFIQAKSEHPPLQPDLKLQVEHKEPADNKSTPQPTIEKKVFSKPHVLPPNNAADGVLPKPDDIDAAVEVPEIKKSNREAKLLQVNERDVDNRINFLQDEKKENPDKANPRNEAENHAQVQLPNNFDIGEKDDHAAERGEYGAQYGLADAKQQVELPAFNGKFGAKRKTFMPVPQQANNNDIAAQMQDMMNKSPGDIDNFYEGGQLRGPGDFGLGPIDKKAQELKNPNEILHRGVEGNNALEDKNYEEDDDDRENDDDQGNGVVMPEMKPHILQDNDFDDQDNQENADNAKEEGVVVAPK